MVENPGKTLRTDAIKLNPPGQIRIQEAASGLPIAMRTPERHSIVAIEDRWRIDDEWWRSESVSRLYYAVITDSGQRIVIYKDLIQNRWYKQ